LTAKSIVSAVLLVAALLASPITHAAQLKITVENIRSLQGTLHISIFSDSASYKKDGNAARELTVEVDSSIQTIVVDDLAEGEYAVALIHDKNENGMLDTNFIGIPKEGYGFSNNGGRFGPPKFSKASFVLADQKHINIKLHSH